MIRYVTACMAKYLNGALLAVRQLRIKRRRQWLVQARIEHDCLAQMSVEEAERLVFGDNLV